jgi:hypothetical protein
VYVSFNSSKVARFCLVQLTIIREKTAKVELSTPLKKGTVPLKGFSCINDQ